MHEDARAVLKELNKKDKEEILTTLEGGTPAGVPSLSTGLLPLDIALGCGGLPMGRMLEVFGPAGIGKTTFTLSIIAHFQSQGLVCAYIDNEHATDASYHKALGVDTESLLFTQPDTTEETFEKLLLITATNKVGLVVVDSVAGMMPRQELEGEMGDSNMGVQGRLMGQGLRKLKGVCASTGCIAIFINQIRANLNPYSNPEVTPGGNALKFFASLRMRLGKGDSIPKTGTALGHKINVKILKNKVGGSQNIVVTLPLIYGKGFCKMSLMVDAAIEKEVITQAGSWYSFDGVKVCQGKEGLKELLEENEEMRLKVESRLKEKP